MDRAARVGKEVEREQESSATWSRYFADNRDWLTKQIDALENMDQIKGERRPTLDLTWVLSLYRLARDYLDAFNESHTMLHDVKTSVQPLERRVGLLEEGASEVAKLPRIAIDWDALANMSKQLRNSGSASHHAKDDGSKSRNGEPSSNNVTQPKRLSRSL